MGNSGKLWGASIGFLLGGPLGAGIGTAIGYLIDADIDNGINVECPHCKTISTVPQEGYYECVYCHKNFIYGDVFSSDEERYYFSIWSLINLIVKLCKIDGKISRNEIRRVDEFFINDLELTGEDIDAAHNLFRELKNETTSYSESATYLSTVITENSFKEDVIHFLFDIAISDGILNKKEDTMISDIANILNLNENEYNQIKSNYIEDIGRYYDILDCNENDPIDIIKQKYYNLVKQYHPDKVSSKGIPEDLVKYAESRFNEIKYAYDFIMLNRKKR
jgi:DnaJ like chaperone protein